MAARRPLGLFPRPRRQLGRVRGGGDLVSTGRPRRKIGKRTLRSVASVEKYLQAGVVPRFIERANQIEAGMRRHQKRREGAYEWAQEQHGQNPDEFARYWREL